MRPRVDLALWRGFVVTAPAHPRASTIVSVVAINSAPFDTSATYKLQEKSAQQPCVDERERFRLSKLCGWFDHAFCMLIFDCGFC